MMQSPNGGGDLTPQQQQQQQQWMAMQQQYQQQWMAMQQYPAAAAAASMAMQQQQMMYQQPQYMPYHYQQQQQQYQPQQQQNEAQVQTSSEENKTIWIGDLQTWMDEHYLQSCFAATGEVISVKLIRNKQSGQSERFGFIEFLSHAAAEKVLQSYNGTVMPNTEQAFRLNWATFSIGERRQDAGSDQSIFVGDLASDVTDTILQETFATRYPSVRGAKVVVDTNTGRSKGYGFVRFGDENEKSRAMSEMNGQYCSSRPMRIGVATPKKPSAHQQYSSQAVVLSGGAAANGAQSETDTSNTTGIIQPDMWGVTPSNRWDWVALRQMIENNKVRNSLLVAPMPTASTSQILGNNEGFFRGPKLIQPLRKIRDAIDNRKDVTVQLINYTKTGKQFWNLFHMQPMRDQKIRDFVKEVQNEFLKPGFNSFGLGDCKAPKGLGDIVESIVGSIVESIPGSI